NVYAIKSCIAFIKLYQYPVEVPFFPFSGCESLTHGGFSPATHPPWLWLHFHGRADLDGAKRRIGNPGRHFESLIQVFAIQDINARELLLRFGEWAVSDQRFAVADANGRRSAGRL